MKKNLFYTTAAVAGMSAVAGYAATTNGIVGDTTSGTLDVKMKVQELVNLSNLTTVDLGTFTPDGTAEEAGDAFCVYYNNSANVDITLTSANNGSGGFNMVDINGNGNEITYTVEVQASPSTGGTYAAHAEGATVKYATADGNADDDCATLGQETTQISMTVADSGTVLGVPSDDYLDTITIKIEPNP